MSGPQIGDRVTYFLEGRIRPTHAIVQHVYVSEVYTDEGDTVASSGLTILPPIEASRFPTGKERPKSVFRFHVKRSWRDGRIEYFQIKDILDLIEIYHRETGRSVQFNTVPSVTFKAWNDFGENHAAEKFSVQRMALGDWEHAKATSGV